MRRADKLGVRHVLIIGDEEISRGEVQVRDMTTKTQTVLPLESVVAKLHEIYMRRGQ
jgi:histidyl-tRNA synthetase